jgi:hypothetical protein
VFAAGAGLGICRDELRWVRDVAADLAVIVVVAVVGQGVGWLMG